MRATSEAFRAAVIASDVQTVSEVWLCEYGVPSTLITIVDGAVSMDAGRNIERTFSFTANDPTGELASSLAVPGAEVAPRMGFDDELVGLGVFVVVDLGYPKPDRTLTVTCEDRGRKVARAKFTQPYQIGQTMTADAIAALLEDRYPGVLYDFGAETGAPLAGGLVLTGGDNSNPLYDACSLASASGLRLVFDGDGVARLKRVTDIRIDVPVLSCQEGAYGVVVNTSDRSTANAVYNGVRATIEGSGVAVPIAYEVWDDDPASPTYCLGPMGRAPRFWSTNKLTTLEDLKVAADTLLAASLGRASQTSWTQLADPAMEPGDVVELIDLAGASRRFVIDTLLLPLSGGTMTVTARSNGGAA